jgi:hypothetical protein
VRPITVVFTIGTDRLQIALEGVDAVMAAQRQRALVAVRDSPKAAIGASRCDAALKSEALLNRQRDRGVNVPYLPEIEGTASACRKAVADREKLVKSGGLNAETTYHVVIHNPLSLSTSQSLVYRSKLLPRSGRVKSISDIQSYVADYPVEGVHA